MWYTLSSFIFASLCIHKKSLTVHIHSFSERHGVQSQVYYVDPDNSRHYYSCHQKIYFWNQNIRRPTQCHYYLWTRKMHPHPNQFSYHVYKFSIGSTTQSTLRRSMVPISKYQVGYYDVAPPQFWQYSQHQSVDDWL